MTAFESVIVFELNHRKENNLIITERSLMYLWIYCQSKNPKISEKIISILNKVCSERAFNYTLLVAYSKTEEWLKDEQYRIILKEINKQIECLRRFEESG